jgi:hypothetical protein
MVRVIGGRERPDACGQQRCACKQQLLSAPSRNEVDKIMLLTIPRLLVGVSSMLWRLASPPTRLEYKPLCKLLICRQQEFWRGTGLLR